MRRQQWGRALGLVIFIGLALGAAVYLLGRVGTSVISTGHKYNFEADVNSSLALTDAADVREAGVLVGRVTGIRRAGDITALKMQIDSQFTPIYNNATVLIRAKSIAGENYVQLDPGTPSKGALADNAVLDVDHELQPVQDDDVFSIFGAPQRAALQKTVKGVGAGLQGQGGSNLNQTLGSMTSLVQQGQSFASILDEERIQTAQLVASFDGVASALGSRATDIQDLTRSSLTTARAVAARNADLRATLAALPDFLSAARTTANRLGSFSTTATPVFSNLRVAFNDLIPAVNELKPAAQEADATLSSLDRFATTALPTFDRLTPFAKTTESVVGPYAKFLQQLAPLSQYLNPFNKEVGSAFANMGSAVDATDASSHLARIILPISRSNFPTIVQGPELQILDELSDGSDTRGKNDLPLPGDAATVEPLTRVVPALGAASSYNAKPPAPLKQPKRKST